MCILTYAIPSPARNLEFSCRQNSRPGLDVSLSRSWVAFNGSLGQFYGCLGTTFHPVSQPTSSGESTRTIAKVDCHLANLAFGLDLEIEVIAEPVLLELLV